jgi:hypothetical protein
MRRMTARRFKKFRHVPGEEVVGSDHQQIARCPTRCPSEF